MNQPLNIHEFIAQSTILFERLNQSIDPKIITVSSVTQEEIEQAMLLDKDSVYRVCDEIKDWIEETKHNYFHLHGSSQVDKELSELYWKYFESDERDIEYLLSQDNFEEVKKVLLEFKDEIFDFFKKIEINSAYRGGNALSKYAYKNGCEFEARMDME